MSEVLKSLKEKSLKRKKLLAQTVSGWNKLFEQIYIPPF